ncbi:NUDIX domain-containing protein [Pelagovum sp. HNIBRBA483]|uniref:NUDIX domain-containing protein n=1 Tax=Pelagovum sp. HNIBRBA483 TaxID=3233341 RepID=UPI0034A4903D
MNRRFGDSPRPDKPYRTRPGIYAVLPMGRDLLLTFQGGIHQELQLPGGGIDPGEQPIAALHREVFEETGWKITAPRRLGSYRRFTFMPEYDLWAEKICHIYLAHPVRQIGPAIEPDHMPVILPRDVAAERVSSPGDRHFLQLL